MNFELKDNNLIIFLEGKMLSDNAQAIENDITKIRVDNEHESLTMDLSKFEYTSSAGLRVFLRLAKEEKDYKIINVSNDVYDVFEMTGFSSMMNIQKGYRTLDISNATLIGNGFFSQVYRIDKDTIVKVFIRTNDYDDVKRELNLAKQGFVLGLPTAISYDIVTVNDHPGVVFELLDCGSLKDLIEQRPNDFNKLMKDYADVVKKINTTNIGETLLPNANEVALGKLDACKEFLDDDEYNKVKNMIQELDTPKTFIHGDCQIKNIMCQNDELLLIDMDTLSYGNPLFELSTMHATYIAFDFFNPVEAFLELPRETCLKIFDTMYNCYFENVSEEDKESNYKKIELMSNIHMVYWFKKNIPDRKDMIEHYKDEVKKCLINVNDLKLVF